MNTLEKILIGGAVGTALLFNPINHAHAEPLQNKQKVSQSQYTFLEQSIVDLEASVKKNHKDPNLHYQLSNLYEQNKQYDKALDEFGIAVKRGLGNTVPLSQRGEFHKDNIEAVNLSKQGKVDKSIESLEKVIKSYEKKGKSAHNSTYSSIAALYNHKKEFDKSIKYLKKAIVVNPTNKNNYQTLGVAYIDKREFGKGLLSLKKMNCIDKKYKTNQFYIGKAYMGLEQYKEASNAFKKFLSIPEYRNYEPAKQLRKECIKLQKEQKYK